MAGRAVLLSILIITQTTSLSGQCPDRDSVLVAISKVDMRDSTQLRNWLAIEKTIRHCNYKDESLQAKLLKMLAVFYYNSGNFLKGVEYVTKTISTIRNTSPGTTLPLKDLGACYQLLSFCYDQLGEQVLRMKAIDSVLSIDRQLNTDYAGTCNVGRYKVEWLYHKGDYKHCDNTAQIVLDKVKEHYIRPDSMQMILYIVTFQIQALIFLDENEKAWGLINSRMKDFKANSRLGYTGVLYNLMTLMYQREKNAVLAAYNIRKSFNSHLGKMKKGCAESMMSLSEVYLDLFKKPDSGLYYARVGLKYADSNDSLGLLTLMARCLVNQQKIEEALNVIKQAFGFLGPGFNENSLIGKPVDEFITPQLSQTVISLVTTKGDAFKKRYDLQHNKADLVLAINVYKCVNYLLIEIKTSQLESESKLSWQKTVHSLYENAIEACYALQRPDAAFYFFENSRAFLLQENLRFSQIMLDPEKEMQANYRLELMRLKEELVGLSPLDPKHQKISAAINDIIIDQEEFRRKLISRLGMSAADPFTVGFDHLKQLKEVILKSHDALIEIFEGDSAIYVWSCSQAEMVVSKCNKKKYDTLVTAYMKGLSKAPDFLAEVKEWQSTSSSLYTLLFTGHQLPKGRLIISNDRNCIPYECLIVGYINSRPRYLVQQSAISYTYSARYLQDQYTAKNGRSAPNDRQPANMLTNSAPRFSGFAPVNFASTMNLKKLSGSDQSLEKIGEDFSNTKIFKGGMATRAEFIKGLMTSNIMHLYTHAGLNKQTAEPEIYFQDSILTLNELVLGEAPTINIINLAACETALGKSYYGEGVLNFSRVLASYGIPASMANIWAVSDKSTYRINELFYKFLAQGIAPDVALQLAKLDFLNGSSNETSFPYYWAATVLTGQSDIIYPPRLWWYEVLALAVCVGMIGATFMIAQVIRNR